MAYVEKLFFALSRFFRGCYAEEEDSLCYNRHNEHCVING